MIQKLMYQFEPEVQSFGNGSINCSKVRTVKRNCKLWYKKICTNLSQKCKVMKKGQSWWILNRFQKKSFADFFQVGALKSFANSTGKHLCWKALLKRNLNAGGFVKFAYFKEHLVLQNSSCGCFWRLTRITGPTVNDKYQIQLKKVFSVAKISTSLREIIPECFYSFMLVSILSFLNFALKKWFCCVTFWIYIYNKKKKKKKLM